MNMIIKEQQITMTSCHLDNRVVFVHRNITNYIIYQHVAYVRALLLLRGSRDPCKSLGESQKEKQQAG